LSLEKPNTIFLGINFKQVIITLAATTNTERLLREQKAQSPPKIKIILIFFNFSLAIRKKY